MKPGYYWAQRVRTVDVRESVNAPGSCLIVKSLGAPKIVLVQGSPAFPNGECPEQWCVDGSDTRHPGYAGGFSPVSDWHFLHSEPLLPGAALQPLSVYDGPMSVGFEKLLESTVRLAESLCPDATPAVSFTTGAKGYQVCVRDDGDNPVSSIVVAETLEEALAGLHEELTVSARQQVEQLTEALEQAPKL